MGREPTVAVITLGCKLNQADSEAIARRLGQFGARVVDRAVPGADAFVINSCSVTHVADRKARHLVRLARRLSPVAEIVLAGCYAETAPADIAGAIGADTVARNHDKPLVADRLLARLRERGEPSAGCPASFDSARDRPVRGLRADGRPSGRTRAFVKIQEGCDELCAFCIVPYTRGRERSVPIEEVVAEVRKRTEEGAREVVLTGTQLGNYGRDPSTGSGRALGWRAQGPRRLLEALLAQTSVTRIRLSSLQAQDITPHLLRLWRDTRLCPHFHLPLQSGCDRVLRAMRRRYTARQYREAVHLIRENVPDVAITTDVIAGFPGESEAEFAETYRLCEELEFAAMHCFPYSRRPHTGAALMRGHLPPAVRRARLELLLEQGRRSSRAFRWRFLGRSMEVLWEQESGGLWQGLTANYIRVYTAAGMDLSNRLLPVSLTRPEGEDVYGTLAPEALTA